jgi:phage-related protein
LFQPIPLTPADILAGLSRMRPSAKAARLEEILNRFLQQLKPLENAIEPAIDEFFGGLRQVLMLLNPLSLRDDVEAIYEVMRTKVRILDPGQLATAISAIFDPVKQGLQAFNPATLKDKLNTTFNNVVHAVTVTVKQVLDDLVDIIDTQLRTLRTAFRAILDQLQATITTTLGRLQDILKQVEDLVFVEVLGRLGQAIDNLGVSFDKELDRVRNAFDEMLAAIPLDGGRSPSAAIAL